MIRTSKLVLAAASLVLFGTGRTMADPVVYPSTVSYYYPAPAVSYYAPPVVYTPPPQVSYYTPAVSYYTPAVSYYTPAVSYYTPAVSYYAPSVSYYAPAAAVTTTRYGLFGVPRYRTTYYYP